LPEALFCSSDLIAYGAHRRLSELGFQVLRDTVLMGFDDNPFNDWIAPWLNSVSVPYAQFGVKQTERHRFYPLKSLKKCKFIFDKLIFCSI
jgi:LacI family transcriptional regulator